MRFSPAPSISLAIRTRRGGRDASEADLTHRALESWYLPPFERVAKEGCATFMLGYESIDGTPVTFTIGC